MSTLPDEVFDDPRDRSPLALPPRHRLGDQYLVGRILGRPGGFGITYLGWEEILERRVAIKEYLPRDLVSRGRDGVTIVPHSQQEKEHFAFGLERFLEEARTLAGLSHPNVVRVHQFFENNGTAYLVMEYHRGSSLAEYLARAGGNLPWRHAIRIVLAMLDGLEATHAQGILHCDIKPQNIYLTAKDQVILLDYGAARLAITERTQTTNRIMTPGYAAWEMYLEHGSLGPWTDVYSSAATLFQLVTGQRLTPAIDRLIQNDLGLEGFPLPQPLVDVMKRALKVRPETRIASAAAFAQELQPLLRLDIDPETSRILIARAKPLEPDDVTRSWHHALKSEEPDGLGPDEAEPAVQPSETTREATIPDTHIEPSLPPGDRVIPERPIERATTGRFHRRFWTTLAAVVLLLGALSIGYWNSREVPQSSQTQPVESILLPRTLTDPLPQLTEQTPETVATGVLIIDASPWGRVVSLTAPDEEALENDLPCVTPCVLDVPIGSFEATVRRESQQETLRADIPEAGRSLHRIRFGTVDAIDYFKKTGW